MLFLAKKTTGQNLKKFGFSSSDDAVHERLNEVFYSLVFNNIKKLSKQQNGGRVVLPSEYFGRESGSYFESAPGVNLTPTSSIIRPAILTNDLTGAIKGGAHVFNISQKSVQMAINKVQNELGVELKGKKLNNHIKKVSQEKLTELLQKVKKVAKSDNHLKEEYLKDALKLKKFSSLCKKKN